MRETLKSVGIDIGTSTTQLVISHLTLENRASPFTVPRVAITEREIVYRSAIHFTPLLSDTVIDADGVRAIVEAEYQQAGLRREDVETGAVIITGETARKENARAVLAALSEFAGDFVVATAGPDLSPSWPPGERGRTNTPGNIGAKYYTLISAAEPPTWPSTRTALCWTPTAWTSAGGSSSWMTRAGWSTAPRFWSPGRGWCRPWGSGWRLPT